MTRCNSYLRGLDKVWGISAADFKPVCREARADRYMN